MSAGAAKGVDRESRRWAEFVRTVVEKIDAYENTLTTDEKVGMASRLADHMFRKEWGEDHLTTEFATYLAALIVVMDNDDKGIDRPPKVVNR